MLSCPTNAIDSYAWIEWFPLNSVRIAIPANPGDVVYASANWLAQQHLGIVTFGSATTNQPASFRFPKPPHRAARAKPRSIKGLLRRRPRDRKAIGGAGGWQCRSPSKQGSVVSPLVRLRPPHRKAIRFIREIIHVLGERRIRKARIQPFLQVVGVEAGPNEDQLLLSIAVVRIP